VHGTSATLIYLAAIFGLLVGPRALQRFRLPAPLTCFALGIVVTLWVKPAGEVVAVVSGLATLGIASLFLFAGLEVNLIEIQRQLPQLLGRLAIRGLFLAVAAWLAIRYLHMAWQPAWLLSLALFTPSTGFILDMLPESGLGPDEQTEVSLNAIAGEITALFLFFFISQAGSFRTLLVSGSALLLVIFFTPLIFLALGKYVVPSAPGSEFSLLLMMGVICAVITKTLGVYYLVGAFIAGLVAGILRKRMPTFVSHENLRAVGLFASVFIPFYFFHAGFEVPRTALVVRSLIYGLLFSLIVIPIRIAQSWPQSRYLARRSPRAGLRVAVALIPTLIFTLVIAGILHEQFHIDDGLFGGLLVYAAITTIFPSLVLPGFVESTLTAITAEAEA
jgi:Kef-type K+ transport system membrane component KefB